MSLTLFDTFRQIDPYVKFNNGSSISTAGKILMGIDPSEPTEYVLDTDGVGRLLIYRLDFRGRLVTPPVYVEEKAEVPRGSLLPVSSPRNFGSGHLGIV